jgi:hypothetical protein
MARAMAITPSPICTARFQPGDFLEVVSILWNVAPLRCIYSFSKSS